ncbi:MAG: GNAT family N-acetyltransferase [Actinomycetales bacterium]
MYWRLGAEYRRRPSESNRADFQALLRDGETLGLVAMDSAGSAVGWCQLTTREDLPWLERSWRVRRVDDTDAAWVLSCFYVRKGWRGRGVTDLLIHAAQGHAHALGAAVLEAIPLDAQVSKSSASTGYADTFLRWGFREIARRSPERPILRCELPAHHGDTTKMQKGCPEGSA